MILFKEELLTFAMASLKSTAFSMDTGRIIVSPDVMTLDEVRALAILWAFTPNRLAAVGERRMNR